MQLAHWLTIAVEMLHISQTEHIPLPRHAACPTNQELRIVIPSYISE